jgi:D-glycero-alpha-D-manno-heptose-7-phosphate kinase
VKEIGLASKAALESGDTLEFARLMDVHWQEKRVRSGLMSNSEIDRWYELGMNHGALGGKLVGAGGGGYLLFYALDRDALRQAMAAEGLSEVQVLFDHDGSTVIVRN